MRLIGIALSVAIMVSSCSNTEKVNSGDETSLSRFSLFSDPVKYSETVRLADNGDERSLILLISYFSYPKNPDMRNLLYWSDRQYIKIGPVAYTNAILALSESDCQESWKLLESKFKKLGEFDFYSKKNEKEYINMKCERG